MSSVLLDIILDIARCVGTELEIKSAGKTPGVGFATPVNQ